MEGYIDAEILKSNIRVNLMPNVDIDGTVTVENAERYFLNLINTTSTADVVEVKHGEWIDDGDCFYCSVCNKTYQLGSLQTIYDVRRCWKYCASCGAKMDGGKK